MDLLNRPDDADVVLSFDETPPDRGGPLVEQAGSNILQFEDVMSNMSLDVSELWKRCANIWINSEVVDLAQLGFAASMGGASAPILSLTSPLKGKELHALG